MGSFSTINESFFDEVFDELDLYFENKKNIMCNEVENNIASAISRLKTLIWGDLTFDDYRELNSAFTKHLLLIKNEANGRYPL